jgi:hypothetical protein
MTLKQLLITWRDFVRPATDWRGNGQITPSDLHLMSSLSEKNISIPDLLDTALLIPAIPPHLRGVAHRQERWVRDAMDAAVSKDERCWSRTAKSCGSDASTLASSLLAMIQ